ncbi:hypothetical protein EVAR_29655_1 [Eumeta japonica]|uniref:Uncharacterized protein n=1 Tax=Eumeta variegata TaxID=151549 RepID=A0A4C1W964_EUMVA|nr:hypothetical protein EVAR_29655_1 [Eumeta japonica]
MGPRRFRSRCVNNLTGGANGPALFQTRRCLSVLFERRGLSNKRQRPKRQVRAARGTAASTSDETKKRDASRNLTFFPVHSPHNELSIKKFPFANVAYPGIESGNARIQSSTVIRSRRHTCNLTTMALLVYRFANNSASRIARIWVRETNILSQRGRGRGSRSHNCTRGLRVSIIFVRRNKSAARSARKRIARTSRIRVHLGVRGTAPWGVSTPG